MAGKHDLDGQERATFLANLMASRDLSDVPVPAAELIVNDKLAFQADRALRQFGAEEVILGRLSRARDIRLWTAQRTVGMFLGAVLLDQPTTGFENETVALTAVRLKESGHGPQDPIALTTIVGHRMAGNRFDILPLGVSEELAYVANSYAQARAAQTAALAVV